MIIVSQDKKELNVITTTIRKILQKDVKITDEEVYTLDGRQYLAIENLLQYINQLENKVKELEKENIRLTYARDWYFENTVNKIVTPEMLHKILRTKYISKDNIEDKKEYYIRLKQKIENEGYEADYTEGKIDVLQELLEEK